jgi:serine/threonine protein kinase
VQQNILIKAKPPESWWVKIGDFGITKRAETIVTASAVMGTPGFIAPETYGAFPKGKVSHVLGALDIWALGEIIHRTLLRQPCFKTQFDIFAYVQGQQGFPSQPLIDYAIDGKALSFLEGLMKAQPYERFSAPLALHHEWLVPLHSNQSRSPSIAFEE